MAKKTPATAGHTEDCTFHNDRTRCTCGRLAADSQNDTGRDSKLTLALQDAICESLRNGATRSDAAIAAGISYQTLLNWEKRGSAKDAEENDPAFLAFFEAVKKAEADCANDCNATVIKAAKKQWQAAAWWLERRRRDEYALRREITGKDGEPFIPDHVAEALKRAGKFGKKPVAAGSKK